MTENKSSYSSYSSYKQGQSKAPSPSYKSYTPPKVSESDPNKRVSSLATPSKASSSKRKSSRSKSRGYVPPTSDTAQSSLATPTLAASPSKNTYTKGGVTFKRTPDGLVRINKAKQINVGLGRSRSGQVSLVSPTSSRRINRGGRMVTQTAYNFGGNKYVSEGGRVKTITDRRTGASIRLSYPAQAPPSSRITFFDFNKQSFDPNLFLRKTMLPIKDSKGRIWGFVDTLKKMTIGFNTPISEQDILKVESSRQPVIPSSLAAKIKADIKTFIDTKQLNINNVPKEVIDSINKNNTAAKLSKVTRTDFRSIVLPRSLQPFSFAVIPPNYLRAANYKGLDKFAVKLARKGFAVPADIILGFQSGLRDWKGALIGFTAGAGIDAAARLTAKSTKSKLRSLSKFLGKGASKIAVPLLLFDLGREYRRLVADGNTPAFALSKAITTFGTTVGGAAVGTKVSGAVLSSSTRKSIASAASRSIGSIKKPTKQTYRNILDFLESANPVRVYSDVILQPSSLKGAKIIKRVNPTTKKEIRTIVDKLESIIRFGNQHVKVIKTVKPPKPSFRVTERGLVPVRYPKSTREISKAYLSAYKKLLSLSSSKPKKLTKSQVNEFEKILRVLRKESARARKLDKGLMVKANRVSTRMGGKPLYQFEDIITGQNKRFFSRKAFLKAVKEQERLIRSGEVQVKKGRIARWLNVINKNTVKPIYPKKNINAKEKQKFINMLLKESARARKLDKGLMVKANRVSTRMGGKPLYQFEDIITGQNKRFFSRKAFLKAVKEQERLIRSGEVQVKKSSLKDFFNTINNQVSNKEGQTIKLSIQRSVKQGEKNFERVKKRVMTLRDINKRSKVKKTSSGGLEVKAANGQVIILETPQTINKNQAVKRAVAQQYKQKVLQKTKTIKLQQLKTKTYKVVVVKPQVLQSVKSFNQSLNVLSRLLSSSTKSAAVIARALISSSRFKKLQAKNTLVEPLLKNGQVKSQAQAQAQINIVSTAQKSKSVQRLKQSQRSSQKIKPLSKQVAISKAKTIFSPRTTNKLLEIDKNRRKRKKIKFSKAEIKYMLNKVYQKGRYRPSLAALIYGITGFKAPKSLTGFELRPIIKKR